MLGLSIEDTSLNTAAVTDDRHEAVPPVNEFVAGYAAAPTRTAYRSDLTLWLTSATLAERWHAAGLTVFHDALVDAPNA